jgi:hypothetical protein
VGCTRAPDIYDITPSQTAFLVPVQGDTKSQTKFASAEFLKTKQIPGKRVQINYHKEYWGTGIGKYNWVPDNYLYIVDRMAVSREWTDTKTDNGEAGDDATNDALRAVSKESIRFKAPANCVAEIQEADAATHLYYYGASPRDPQNNKYVYEARKLENVIDKEIRIKVAGKFAEECAKYPLRELVTKKDIIMENVRKAFIPAFAKRGITITALALQGDFVYDDAKIQDAFNSQFTTAQEALAQQNANQRALEKAQNDVKVARMIASSKDIITLRKLDNEKYKLETERLRWGRWNGVQSPYVGYFMPGSLPAAPLTNTPAPVAPTTPQAAPTAEEVQ